jgi:hypothetical protein
MNKLGWLLAVLCFGCVAALPARAAHGDLSMMGPKPTNGLEGLKQYDPEAFALMDDFYSGRIDIGKAEPRFRRRAVDVPNVEPQPNASK